MRTGRGLRGPGAVRIWGEQAAHDDKPITSNPFPVGHGGRAAWDEGWREVAGAEPAPAAEAASAAPEQPGV